MSDDILLAPPVANWRQYRISQVFGANRSYYLAYGLDGHEGIDLAMASGTRVLASHAGSVQVLAAPSSYGLYAMLLGERVITLYGHLSAMCVEDRQHVDEGHWLGDSGNSGRSTGDHLHWSVFPLPRAWNNGFKGAVDPLPYLLAWEAGMAAALTQAQGNRYRIEEVVRRIQRAEALEREALALREEARQELNALVDHNGPLYHLEALLGGPTPPGYAGGGQGA